MAQVREGYLGQGKNVQENSSFFMYSVLGLNGPYAYPLSTLEQNMEAGVIKKSQGIELVARSYFDSKKLAGPYTAAVVSKFAKRLGEIEKKAREGAYDIEKFYGNVVNSTNWGSTIDLIQKEDKLNIMKFY